jgi:hypothetical protein
MCYFTEYIFFYSEQRDNAVESFKRGVTLIFWQIQQSTDGITRHQSIACWHCNVLHSQIVTRLLFLNTGMFRSTRSVQVVYAEY